MDEIISSTFITITLTVSLIQNSTSDLTLNSIKMRFLNLLISFTLYYIHTHIYIFYFSNNFISRRTSWELLRFLKFSFDQDF